MYVFGRYQYRREISLEGEVGKRMQPVAMSAWRVSLKQHHEGYITLEEFVKNQERLQKNRTNGEETVLSGPAREGLALLQGLLLCGNCGHALTVRYRGNGGICPTYQCNLLRGEGLATKSCMVFRCDLLDGGYLLFQHTVRTSGFARWGDRGGDAEGIATGRTGTCPGGYARDGITRSGDPAPMADADRAC
jgi:hypothetical protein